MQTDVTDITAKVYPSLSKIQCKMLFKNKHKQDSYRKKRNM